MKRTLTAAATLLVGSAGAVGLAGTANAVEAPEPPTTLPVDNNVAQTAFHAASAMHSATQAVGDVVPMDKPVQTLPTEPLPSENQSITEALPSDATGVEGMLTQTLPTEPLSSVQPGAKAGDPVTGALGSVLGGSNPLQGLTGGANPLQGLAGANPLQHGLGDAQLGGLPTGGAKQSPLPEVPVVDQLAGQVAAPVAGAAGGSKSGATDPVSGVVGQVLQLQPGQLPTDQLTGGGLPTGGLPVG